MTDKQIKEILKVPHSTLWTWKYAKSTQYKNNLYQLLKNIDSGYVEFLLKNINNKKHNINTTNQKENKEDIKTIIIQFINNISVIMQKINVNPLNFSDLIFINNTIFHNLHRFIGLYVILTSLEKEILLNNLNYKFKVVKLIEKTLKLQKKILIFLDKEVFQDIEYYAIMAYWIIKKRGSILREILNKETFFANKTIFFAEYIHNSDAKKILKKEFSSKFYDNNREKIINDYLQANQKISKIVNSNEDYDKYQEKFLDKISSLYKRIMFEQFSNF